MKIESLVRSLGAESTLAAESSEQLVSDVLAYAKERARDNDAYRYGKPPTWIRIGAAIRTSPAQVLHELGVATTFLTASPLAQVARHWAHVRYCATLDVRDGHLALSQHAGNVVHHHKVAQSEQLGIGLALVVAKEVLRRQYPRWDFHAVDAEVALKAGFLDGVGEVATTPRTTKRPDYILLGHHRSGRRNGMKIVVLECKGTHQSPGFAHGQLARAAVQVDALRVGGRSQPSLMVASYLSRTRITSYVLDPPGDDELWSGADDELDELLGGAPGDQDWRPQPAPPDEARTWEVPADADLRAEASDVSPAEDLPPGRPDVFDIPAERRGWFTQILTRAAAATALLFAGDNGTARAYATPRQRDEQPDLGQQTLFEIDLPWASSTARTLRLPNGLRAEGTRYRAPLPDGEILEVFRGVESSLYRQLADGQLGAYFRAAPQTFRQWARTPLNGGVLSVGRDGTVLAVRRAERH
ncbi:hypothetical protein [Micromonospora sp. WMMA1947]|uniref:hypothetical protein n=2 Tax=Micromonospora TaxID=1873 RepID=UPI00248C0530|nr:hypothetical protein [Micromonospora sp. WMMA1947]WBC08361.1 hypothetical protein O7604_24465 [Micromonospora sp. WMMA1947]